MNRIFSLSLIIMFLFSACSDNSIISDKEKFAALYVDLQLNVERNREKPDLMKRGMDSVLKKYNVTREMYYNTIEYLGHDKGKWEEIFNIVNTRINNMKKQG